MRRSLRLKASLAAAVTVAILVPTVLLIGSAPAAPTVSKTATAHKCLVMVGSGDNAVFTRNFNPYTATGLPSGQFVQGSFFEPLMVTPLGGLPTRGWLAHTWSWSRGGKTLTLNLVHNAKWSDGKPLTSTDVVYSLTAGRQDKLMDRIGLTGADNNIPPIKPQAQY